MFTVDSQMFYTVPIMAFAFVCHPEVLPIYTELRWPSKRRIQTVANVSIGAMFCMYELTATFGYLTFYTLILLFLINVLVICMPTIRDIFGVIGFTSAPSLNFILPSVFYLCTVPSKVELLSSWPKIQVNFPQEGWGKRVHPGKRGRWSERMKEIVLGRG
uniref:Solute carrier family 38 member 5 n=1 Tax=Rousettus aegyptiacus TaxID=9407 RepID=A0A7J8ELR9_ROUAE|nr:solute carrier family 38 member 5 [Rousettus aegyptiacus]